MFIGQISLACFITLFLKEDLRRINSEKSKKVLDTFDKENKKEEKDFKLNITENTVTDIS